MRLDPKVAMSYLQNIKSFNKMRLHEFMSSDFDVDDDEIS